ncbi:MAG: HlyC/CorC family transporter [Lachnospiraceae bacterium]|nr:HlyC/CorC family transporter [Lachnospiraceae bacterium]
MPDYPIRSLVVIIILILFNAVVSGAEAALSALNEANLRKAAQEDDATAQNLLKILESEFGKTSRVSIFNVIEFLLITINLVIGYVYAKYQVGYLRKVIALKTSMDEGSASISAILIGITIAIVYFMVVFGVLFPQKLSQKNLDKKALFYGRFIKAIYYIIYPIIWLADKNTQLLLWLFRVKPEEIEGNVTEEEIISMVNEGQETGVLESSEAEMISNIIEFDDKKVRDIMTHRRKMVVLSDDTSLEDALHFMLDNGNYSRFPIYHENIDDIVGIVHIKDVMTCLFTPVLKGKTLHEIATTPYFVPDTRNIDALLHDMQNNKVHMAVVIDEYGQTAGIITLEDIVEEIVGDIQDEYDNEKDSIFDQGDNEYLATGESTLEELEDEIGIDFPSDVTDNYDTLNGLLISNIGRIPEDGEQLEVVLYGFRFDILEIQDKMIKMVKITKLDEAAGEDKKENNE